MHNPLKAFHFSKQNGITGIETAIIVIAFIVVAAVLAYSAVTAGLFSSERGRQATHDALTSVQQCITSTGSVTARQDLIDISGTPVGDIPGVVSLTFKLKTTAPDTGIDITPPYQQQHLQNKLIPNEYSHSMIINYFTDKTVITDAAWTMEFIGHHDGDQLLEAGEVALVTVWLVNLNYHPHYGNYYELGNGAGDPFIDGTSQLLNASDWFELEIIPASGGTLSLSRTLPPFLETVMQLNT